jgi:hypothetical protein
MIAFLLISFIVGFFLMWLTKIVIVYVSFILCTRINNGILNEKGLKHLLAYWKVINW